MLILHRNAVTLPIYPLLSTAAQRNALQLKFHYLAVPQCISWSRDGNTTTAGIADAVEYERSSRELVNLDQWFDSYDHLALDDISSRPSSKTQYQLKYCHYMYRANARMRRCFYTSIFKVVKVLFILCVESDR